MVGRVLVLLAVVIASLGAAESAAAEEGAIDYEAPAECPPKDELLAAIAARTVATAPVDPRAFRVVVERSEAGDFVGRLEVPGGIPRTTRAASCAAVVKTMAVFVVIARTPADAAEPPASAPAPPPPVRRPRPPPRKKPPPNKPRFGYGASIRPSLLVPSEAGPVGAAVRVQGELAWHPPRILFAPVFRLSYGTAGFQKDVDAGEAAFRFRTGRAEGCASFELTHALSAAPCVGGELGALDATTSKLPVPVRASTRWDALTAGFGVRWSIVPWLSVGADITALVPITRRKFGLVDPMRLVYAVPAAYLDMGAVVGVGAQFD